MVLLWALGQAELLPDIPHRRQASGPTSGAFPAAVSRELDWKQSIWGLGTPAGALIWDSSTLVVV